MIKYRLTLDADKNMLRKGKSILKASLRNFLFVLLMAAYLFIGFYFTNSFSDEIMQDYYNVLGTKATDLAKMASRSFTITDEQVKELKALEYKDTINHPVSKRLEWLFADGNFSRGIKYAYVVTLLEDDEIKYKVDETDTEFYGAPPGTPLNLMWLVDVTVNPDERLSEISNENYYNDKNRYSYARDYDYRTFSEKKELYEVTEDEYGKSIVGSVPIYSETGVFVGFLNVDIYYAEYQKHVQQNHTAFLIIFLLPTIVLSLIYLFVYVRKVRLSNKSANTDPLTSLYNRRYLDNALSRGVSECYSKKSSLSVIMIDIDYFKNYNDNYGHQAGDMALINISAAIVTALRQNTDVVCRYGGEEIIVLLPHTEKSGAIFVAEKIKQAIEALKIPHEHSKVCGIVTVSQGVYSAVPANVSKDTACDYIIKADAALYRAKNEGRNRYVVSE